MGLQIAAIPTKNYDKRREICRWEISYDRYDIEDAKEAVNTIFDLVDLHKYLQARYPKNRVETDPSNESVVVYMRPEEKPDPEKLALDLVDSSETTTKDLLAVRYHIKKFSTLIAVVKKYIELEPNGAYPANIYRLTDVSEDEFGNKLSTYSVARRKYLQRVFAKDGYFLNLNTHHISKNASKAKAAMTRQGYGPKKKSKPRKDRITKIKKYALWSLAYIMRHHIRKVFADEEWGWFIQVHDFASSTRVDHILLYAVKCFSILHKMGELGRLRRDSSYIDKVKEVHKAREFLKNWKNRKMPTKSSWNKFKPEAFDKFLEIMDKEYSLLPEETTK